MVRTASLVVQWQLVLLLVR